MKISRVLGTVLMVVGCVLLAWGIVATQTPAQKVVGVATGYFTDRTMWFIIGGVALLASGFGIRRL